MVQTIITEQKKVRLSMIVRNANTCYSVETQNYKGNWYIRCIFNSTANGLEKALLLYYRLILCEIDANIIMDIDNDLDKFII